MKFKINPAIFRAYDIRGIYPSELNEETAYLIGGAFVKFLKKKNPKIVIGRDNRLSSPTLFKSLVKGVKEKGANVIDINLSTTPMFYWAVAHYGFDAGIQISASHNPPEYNGFKLVREDALPISEKTGLKQIKKFATQSSNAKIKRGSLVRKNILEEYLKFNLQNFFNLKETKPLSIVIDTANAVPGILIHYLKNKLPLKVYHLFARLDGSFPNHPPNPLIKENLKFLQNQVKKKKADFGIAFDGDGDRIIFVDEKGKVVSGDLITAFLADLILEANPRAKILFDVRSSRAVKEVIEEKGGQPVIWKIGHSFIKEKMRKENIFFAGEFSGHYYHRDHFFSEAPLFCLFKILETLCKTKKSLSAQISPFKRYFHSGEINFQVGNKKKVLEILEDKFGKNGKVLKIDGVRVDFNDWWFLARPSGTEDILRLVVEAKTKKLMEEKKKELSQLIADS